MFELEQSNRLAFTNANNNNTYCLILKKATVEDAGPYTVTARNSKGRVTSTATLRVSVPARITESPQDQQTHRYGDVEFHCAFTGYPAATPRWTLDSHDVIEDDTHVIETDAVSSTLVILNCSAADVGVLTCHVRNKVAEVSASANLTIIDVPSTPGQPQLDHVQSTSVSLSWSPPNDVQVCPVNFYVIQQRNVEDREDDWNIVVKKVLENTVQIDNIDSDEEFQFRVIAVNDVGRSDPSLPSEKVFIKASPKAKRISREESVDAHAHEDSSDDGVMIKPTERKKKSNRDLRSVKDVGSSCDEMDAASNGSVNGASRPLSRSSLASSRLTPTSVGEALSSSDSDSTKKGTGVQSLRRGKNRSSSPLLFSGSRASSRNRSKSPLVTANGSPVSANEMPIGPPLFTKELEDCFIIEHKAARFKCRVVANPEAEIEWFKEGEVLHETKQYTMLFDADDFCTLIITEVNTDTAGKFTCVAKNSEGSVASSAMLYVEGLATEYETDTEEEVSDPEPLPEKKEITLKKDDVESFYVLKEELGRGKFGVVSKCEDKISSKEYAAKFMKYRPSERKNIQNEIDIMNSLNHKRLIQLYDAYEMPKRIVLILELVSGGELFEKLTELEFISEHDVTFYMKQVLQGIQHMHDNEILHLDLKPENIMLVSPNSNQVKLIDFGLARRFTKGKTLKVLFGTPEFIAPEVINYEQVTPQTDLWSIGVITYVLLSGLSPFMGDNDNETLSNITRVEWDFDDPVFEDISDEAKDFIEDLLVKDQRKRATTKDCFEHPWFKFKKSNKKLKTDRLKAFTARRKWKKTITAVRSTNFLTRLLSGVKAANEEERKQERLVVKATTQTPSPTEERQVKTPPPVGWKKAELVEEDVEFQAPSFHKSLQDTRSRQGESLKWEVSFASEQKPTVTWKREGKELFDSSKIKHFSNDDTAYLQFTSCKCSDTGRYSVRLENKHGSRETSAQLIITDVPSAPTEPCALEVTSKSALVQWKAGFDGNSPLIGYNLQSRALGDHDWEAVIDGITETLYQVDNLKPGNSYKFRVSALNNIGQGEWSETHEFIETPETDHHAMQIENKSFSADVSNKRTTATKATSGRNNRLSAISLKEENPELYYNFKDEIGRGKFAVVKRCSHKRSGESFAAKLIKYDDDTLEITKKEFELWQGLSHDNLVALHDAYLVRKYLVLMSDVVHGEPVLDYLGHLTDLSEENVAGIVLQLLNVLDYLHCQDIVHLDITPSNALMHGPNLKLIDYGCARHIQSRKGEVGEMVGTAEFMAPETINFEPITGATDMWNIGVITYCMLSGVSPFASDDEDESMASITALDFRFPFAEFGSISDEAKSFIKQLIIRIPERRPSAVVCVEDPWLQPFLSEKRKSSKIDQTHLLELSEYLKEQDKMEEVRASLVLRTFLQSPYQSPESSSTEEEGDEA